MSIVARQDSSGSETRTTGRLVALPTAAPSAASRPPKRRWVVAAPVVLLLLAVAVAGWWAFSSGEGVNHATAAVTVGPIQRTVTATGTINPELTIIVGTYVSGVIQELYCDLRHGLFDFIRAALSGRRAPNPGMLILVKLRALRSAILLFSATGEWT